MGSPIYNFTVVFLDFLLIKVNAMAAMDRIKLNDAGSGTL
jgi:hypothetical protein